MMINLLERIGMDSSVEGRRQKMQQLVAVYETAERRIRKAKDANGQFELNLK